MFDSIEFNWNWLERVYLCAPASDVTLEIVSVYLDKNELTQMDGHEYASKQTMAASSGMVYLC